MEQKRSLFGPLLLIAAGVIWLLVRSGTIPAGNLWALTHIWPFLLIAAGLGIILRSYWSYTSIVLDVLIIGGAVVALILALVNSYLKPILKVLSFPITLLSMGLFALVLNAFLLLLVAFVADYADINFTIGGFPPNFTADSFVGAMLASIVISIVSIVLGMLDRGRRLV